MELTTTKSGLAVQQNSHPLLQPKIKDLPKEELFKTVAYSVAKTFANLNNKEISENDREYLVNELTRNIKTDPTLSSIRLNEIPIAFAKGIRKEYGEYYGLSVITFESFIKSYLLSEERKELVKTIPQLQAPKEPDNLTKFKIAKENAIKAFELKKDGKDNSLFGLPVYEFLDSLKLIDFTTKDKLEFLNNARIELATETETQLHTEKNAIRSLEIKKSLQNIIDGKETELVIVRAKKIALNAFFECIILEYRDLYKMIDDKQSLFMEGLKDA